MLEQHVEFFCHACLENKQAEEKSSDPRYCQGCYEFLLEEAKMDTSRKVKDWKPTKPSRKAKIEDGKVAEVSTPIRTIMSTLRDENIKVDKIQPSVAPSTTGKRGRKRKQLPEHLIKQLNDEGMGSKAIATRLRTEHGVTVSYKTIQRVLSGERKERIEIDTSLC